MMRIEPGRRVAEGRCDCCGQRFRRASGYVEDPPHHEIAYFLSAYDHEPGEAWVDAIFVRSDGSHVTFGARYGAVAGQSTPAFALAPGGAFTERSPELFGDKLDEGAARADPLLPRFWELVDHLYLHDPLFAEVRRA